MPDAGLVLVVDDDPDTVEHMEMSLSVAGYKVICAYGGEEAVEAAGQAHPDVVLLDIMMPGMDGYEVINALKKNPDTADIPILLMTALDGVDDKVNGLDSGADDFQTKPVNREELLARVRSLVRLKRLRDGLRAGSDAGKEAKAKSCPLPEGPVLVVEGNADYALVFKAQLERAGYKTVIAGSGREAVAQMESLRPSLILLAVRLPDTDGIKFLSDIKGGPSTASMPVIMVSSVDDPKTKVKGFDSGADDYLVKPVDTQELLARVRATLRKTTASSALRTRLDVAISQSLTDELTGLYNRHYLQPALEKDFAAAKRYGTALSVIMLDIDHFKKINDTHGHPAGDEVLKELGGIIRQSLRAGDTAARYGGEEFVVLLPSTGILGALSTAGKLRFLVERHAFSGLASARVTISLGVAEFRDDDDGPESLVKRADDALYAAKRNGRNRVEVIRPYSSSFAA